MNPLQTFLNDRVRIFVGDITLHGVDALVNAANSTLLGGGGVDGAIHRTGGPAILAACQELRQTRFPKGLPTGEAVITTGGLLAARFVIHTVGPIYGRWGGRDGEMLANCYRNSLTVAVENQLSSVAFPAISTGVYGYPREEAATVASTAIAEFLQINQTLNDVRMVFFSESDARVFVRFQTFSNSSGNH